MSRTRHHRGQKRQHCGEDFWSRRAGMGSHAYSAEGKRLTIAKERMEQKQELHKQVSRHDNF